MKKIVLNISDITYEKLRLEALSKNKDVQKVIIERLLERPFEKDIENSFNEWIEQEIKRIIGE